MYETDRNSNLHGRQGAFEMGKTLVVDSPKHHVTKTTDWHVLACK
jgi:hypothetical protein